MERTVRIFWEDEYLGEVLTNRSLTKTGAIYALGYDVNDPADCEQAYNNGFAAAYVDDNGNYQIDTIGINFRYGGDNKMANRFTFEYGNISNDRWTTTTVVTNKKTFAEYLQSEGFNVTLWELVPGVYMQIDKHNMPTGLAFGLKHSTKTDEPESGEICL